MEVEGAHHLDNLSACVVGSHQMGLYGMVSRPLICTRAPWVYSMLLMLLKSVVPIWIGLMLLMAASCVRLGFFASALSGGHCV